MKLKTPKPLDLKLKTRENPWFQIEFFGGFLAVNLVGVDDLLSDDVRDVVTLVDTKRRSFGYRPDYERAVKTLRGVAASLRRIPHSDQTEVLLEKLWVSLHKAMGQLP